MKKLHIRLLSLLLAAIMLAGCQKTQEPAPDGEAPDGPEITEEEEANPPVISYNERNAGYSPADKLFSLNYDPDGSLNPLYSINVTNDLIMSLMYEGLFRIGPDLTPEPVLCESYTTADGINYTFKLKPDIYFHDGATLTAEDVVYSVNRAAGGSKYSSRFKNIRAINAYDDLTLRVVLKEANYDFPALLDLPIIHSGTSDQSPPSGTGPYTFHSYSSTAYLTSFYRHRDYASLPATRIYLKNIESSIISREFSARTIDLLERDPLSIVELNIHSDYETRYYDTANIIYLGFNTSRGPMRDPAVRRVVACLPDYDEIREDCFLGAVTPAPLVISPALSYYDPSWEEAFSVSPTSFTDLAIAAGLQDTDNNGFWDASDMLSSIKLTFVVNNENPYRLEAARSIEETLTLKGFEVTLQELSYSEYRSALESGSFDIYLGEAKLTPDFDLSSILGSGGAINYGHAGGYDSLLSALYGTADPDEKLEAARALCEYAAEDKAIVPIAYKRCAVFTHPGVVSGMTPTMSGVFGNIKDWTINFE